MHRLQPCHDASSSSDERSRRVWKDECLYSPGPVGSSGRSNESQDEIVFNPRNVSCIRYDTSVDGKDTAFDTFDEPSESSFDGRMSVDQSILQGLRRLNCSSASRRATINEFERTSRNFSEKSFDSVPLEGFIEEFADGRNFQICRGMIRNHGGRSMASSISTIFEGESGRKRPPIYESTPMNAPSKRPIPHVQRQPTNSIDQSYSTEEVIRAEAHGSVTRLGHESSASMNRRGASARAQSKVQNQAPLQNSSEGIIDGQSTKEVQLKIQQLLASNPDQLIIARLYQLIRGPMIGGSASSEAAKSVVSGSSISSSSHMNLPPARTKKAETPSRRSTSSSAKCLTGERSIGEYVTLRGSCEELDDAEREEFERTFCKPESVVAPDGWDSKVEVGKLSASSLPTSSNPSSNPSSSQPPSAPTQVSLHRQQTPKRRASESFTRKSPAISVASREEEQKRLEQHRRMNEIESLLLKNRRPLEKLIEAISAASSASGPRSNRQDPLRPVDDPTCILEVTHFGSSDTNADLPDLPDDEVIDNEGKDCPSMSDYLKPSSCHEQGCESKSYLDLKNNDNTNNNNINIINKNDNNTDVCEFTTGEEKFLCKELFKECRRIGSEKPERLSADKGIQVSFEDGSEWKSPRSATPSVHATSDEGFEHGEDEEEPTRDPPGSDRRPRRDCGAYTPENLSLGRPHSACSSPSSSRRSDSLESGNVVFTKSPNQWVICFEGKNLMTSSLQQLMKTNRPELIDSIRKREGEIQARRQTPSKGGKKKSSDKGRRLLARPPSLGRQRKSPLDARGASNGRKIDGKTSNSKDNARATVTKVQHGRITRKLIL